MSAPTAIHLVAAEESGDRLSTDELESMAIAVLIAGTDTTRNQLACSVALFMEHPDQWALLVERPELAPRAVVSRAIAERLAATAEPSVPSTWNSTSSSRLTRTAQEELIWAIAPPSSSKMP